MGDGEKIGKEIGDKLEIVISGKKNREIRKGNLVSEVFCHKGLPVVGLGALDSLVDEAFYNLVKGCWKIP
jgi:hypothetical protein